MKRPQLIVPIPAYQLRRLAVRAAVDPRTILAVAAGRRVRGLAGERARAALAAAGYPVPDPQSAHDGAYGGEK